MEKIFALVGKFVFVSALIAGGVFLGLRWLVPKPPVVPEFGFYEIDGKMADRIMQVFGSPNQPTEAAELPENWTPTDWDAQLGHNLTYVDPSRRRWNVPKGEVNDGASVPKILWSFCPGGHNGRFLAAAIVHDRFCRLEEARREIGVEWIDVHRMFYYAMRASDVPEKDASVMYAAVLCFGPPKPFSVLLKALASRHPERAAFAKNLAPDWEGWTDPQGERVDADIAARNRSVQAEKDRLVAVNQRIAVAQSTMEDLRGSIMVSPAGVDNTVNEENQELYRKIEELRREEEKLKKSQEEIAATLKAEESELVVAHDRFQAAQESELRAIADINKVLDTVAANDAILTPEQIEALVKRDFPDLAPPGL